MGEETRERPEFLNKNSQSPLKKEKQIPSYFQGIEPKFSAIRSRKVEHSDPNRI